MALLLNRRFRLDSSWWRHRNGDDVVVAGSPLRVFRLGAAGSRLADVLESDGTVPAGTESLAERFVEAGAIHPVVTEPTRHTPADVTVVIPARDEPHFELANLVASLGAARRVVVVDDGSSTEIAALAGADVVRRGTAGGPGAARNTGATLVDTDLVLFVDADTKWNDGAWSPLLAHLDDDTVGLVAPRVASEPGPSLVARYETTDSPLDLGPEPAHVRPTTRVSYVPAAALLVRRSVFESLGGFDPALRYGEDVDFVWRASKNGIVCRYEPSAIVHHRPRRDLAGLARQRFTYGSAAASLASRHDGAVVPLRINRWSALAWGAIGAGHPIIGSAIGVGSTAALTRKLASTPHKWILAGRLAGRGNLHAGRLIAASITRSWWPIALVGALVSRRARRVVLAAVVIPGLVAWRHKKPAVDPIRYVALRVVDDTSYGAGVWAGVLKSREPGRAGALRPRFD